MNDGVLEQLRLKYFRRDDKGELLETTPEQMFRRVAHAVAAAEKTEEERETWEEIFYDLMASYTFLPNSPCLMNAGTEIKSLAACFVLDIEDSRAGISKTLGDAMEVFASGGGVGFPFSKLRAKGDLVSTTKGQASGPVSFAQLYDALVGTIKQGGKRRGAAMGTLRVDHPDVFEFIQVKRDKRMLNNFNLSVLITDEFMNHVIRKEEQFWARDPRTNDKRGFNLPDGTIGPANPQELWEMIIDGAWQDGEPGVYFIDNAERANPFKPEFEEMRLTGPNPCGEATLRAYESCVLGSINLTKFADRDGFHVEEFKDVVKKAIRFLDNVVDVSVPPLEAIEKTTKETRKVGLGVMGLHDALLLMELPYSLSRAREDTTREMVESIFLHMRVTANEASKELAIERGPFPAFDKSTFKVPRRNACVLSVAPTGTLARICDVSFGIEPVQYFTAQNNLTDVQYEHTHILAQSYYNLGLSLPDFYEEAGDILPEDHIEMQALVQEHVDQAVSKTILLPFNTSRQSLSELFELAWRKGIKGFTVYRDGSRADQPISSVDTSAPAIPEMWESILAIEDPSVGYEHPCRERTTTMYGPSYKVKTPEGSIYVDVHSNQNEEVCELMLQLSDGFTDTEKGLANWAARLLSIGLQYGIDYDRLVKQGASTEFEHKSRAYPGRVFWFGTNGKQKAYRSIPEVVSDLIIQEVNRIAYDMEEDIFISPVESEHVCPMCGTKLYYVEGCLSCMECGYSKCT